MRALLRYVLTPLIILGALFSLVNSCDRRLDPKIREFTATVPSEVPDDRNAFFAMIGHDVAPGLDPHTEGVAAVAVLEEKFSENPETGDFEREEAFGAPGLALSDTDGILDDKWSLHRLETARSRGEEIRRLMLENSILVDRYRELHRYEHFAETTSIPYFPDALTPLRETQRAVLLGTALLYEDEGVDAFLSALEDDVRFWRGVLGSTRRLVNKMVAVAALHRNILLLSDFLANHAVDEDLARRVTALATPLNAEERGLSPALRAEFAQVLIVITSELLEKPQGRMALRIKKNATQNDLFRIFRDDMDLYSLPADKWLAQRKLRKQEREEGGRTFFSLLQYFYNPMGKMIVPMILPDFSAFPGKVHNLDAYLAVVNIQLALQQQAIPPGDVPPFIAAACPPHCDPYTLEPFAWNEEEGILSFTDPLSEKPRSLRVR